MGAEKNAYCARAMTAHDTSERNRNNFFMMSEPKLCTKIAFFGERNGKS